LKQQPDNAEARLSLAQGLLAIGDSKRAEPELARLMRNHGASAAVQTQLGVLYATQRDVVRAREAFQRALTLNPEDLEALTGLVALEAGAQRLPQARRLVDAQLANRPHDASRLILAAKVDFADGNLKAAEAKLKTAIDVEPWNLTAYGTLGHLLFVQHRLDEALADFKTVALRDPKSIAAPTMVAVILEALNRPNEAMQQYEQILQVDRTAAVAANNLAWLYSERGGNLDVALHLAQTAQEKLPTNPDVNDTLGWICFKKNLSKAAVDWLQLSVNGDDTSAVHHFHLGMAYFNRREFDKARRSLERALALQHDFQGSNEANRVLAAIR
jgi:tetratricopeptide (TPR) repeat protein